jgi:Protein of unknown function (DUF2934)
MEFVKYDNYPPARKICLFGGKYLSRGGPYSTHGWAVPTKILRLSRRIFVFRVATRRITQRSSYSEHLIAVFQTNDQHYCGGMLPRAEVHLPRSGPVPSLGRFRHYIEFETQGEKEEDMAGWAEDFSPKSAPQIAGDNPTHEEIGLRAHEIFIERGGAHGHDMEDWLEAERQLLDERAKTGLKVNAAVV